MRGNERGRVLRSYDFCPRMILTPSFNLIAGLTLAVGIEAT